MLILVVLLGAAIAAADSVLGWVLAGLILGWLGLACYLVVGFSPRYGRIVPAIRRWHTLALKSRMGCSPINCHIVFRLYWYSPEKSANT